MPRDELEKALSKWKWAKLHIPLIAAVAEHPPSSIQSLAALLSAFPLPRLKQKAQIYINVTCSSLLQLFSGFFHGPSHLWGL